MISYSPILVILARSLSRFREVKLELVTVRIQEKYHVIKMVTVVKGKSRFERYLESIVFGT